MDEHIDALAQQIKVVREAAVAHLTKTAGTSDYGDRLNRLAMEFVLGALRIRDSQQGLEYGARDLIADTFVQIFMSLPPQRRPPLRGESTIFAPGHLDDEGVTGPEQWKIRYSVTPVGSQ